MKGRLFTSKSTFSKGGAKYKYNYNTNIIYFGSTFTKGGKGGKGGILSHNMLYVISCL